MHGRRRPNQTSPVPRRVIAVVDQLVARVALRRRIVVVLVSDSGVVEALRMRRCFPASCSREPRLGVQYRPQPSQSMDVDPVASSCSTASMAMARGMPCQRRELEDLSITSRSARAAQGVQTATMSRNTVVRCGSC